MVLLKNILQDNVTITQLLQNITKREKSYQTPLNPFQKGDLIRKRCQKLAEKIIKDADDCLLGNMVLPGSTEPQYIGNPPLWLANPRGHEEYLFHLNRMEHWNKLLEAYTISGDKVYAQKVIEELENWIDTCPRPSLTKANGEYDLSTYDSVTPWRALECGIRPYRSWSFVVECLTQDGLLSEPLLEKLVISMYEHGETLYNISPLLWPKADHNHCLMENLGLLYISCTLPELRCANAWKKQAISELCRCMENQVDTLGAQIEGCPSYHSGCIFWFAMVMVYSRRFGFSLPREFTDKFAQMFEYALYVTRPTGTCAPWGDSSTTDIVASSAVSSYLGMGDRECLRTAIHFVSYESLEHMGAEHLWRFDDLAAFLDALDSAKASPKKPTLDTVLFDPELKHLYMRTGWDKEAFSVTFACRTPIQNLHAHIDPCGFDFTALGRPLVVDPGRYSYAESEARRNFKSSKWHNTLTVNNKDAWEYISSWAYGPQKEGSIVAHGRDDGILWGIASHLNYEPVVHTRALAICYGSFLLVLDLIDNLQDSDTLQTNFHLDNPISEINCQNGVAMSCGKGTNVAVCATVNTKLELLSAKVSDNNDSWRDSCIAQFHYAVTASKMAIATVILPLAGTAPIILPTKLIATRTENGADATFELNNSVYNCHVITEVQEDSYECSMTMQKNCI